jgi:hypothetical protein
MSERRTLTILVLLVLAAAAYIWWKRNSSTPDAKKSPSEIEAAERSKADPFPATNPGK